VPLAARLEILCLRQTLSVEVLGALVALIHVAFGHALVSLVRARCLAGAAHAAQLLAAVGQLAYADIAVPVAVRDALQVQLRPEAVGVIALVATVAQQQLVLVRVAVADLTDNLK